MFKSKQENQAELRDSLSKLGHKAMSEEIAWAKRNANALHTWALEVYLEFDTTSAKRTKEE